MKARNSKIWNSFFPPINSLRGRIGSVVSGSFLVVVLLTILAVFAYTYRAEVEGWHGRQGEAARAGAERVNVFIDQVESALLMLNLLEAEELQNDRATARAFLDINPAILEVVVLDKSGEPQYSLSKDEAVLDNAFTILQSHWYQTAHAGSSYLGSVQISAMGEPYLILAQPLADDTVIAARIKMEVLWQVVRDIHFGQTGVAYVVNSDGLIIAHPQPEVVFASKSIPYEPTFEQMQTDGDGWYGEASDLNGVAVVSASAPVGETGWVLVTEMQQSEAYSKSRTALVLTGAGMVGLVFVIMTVLKGMMNRLVVDPVDRLLEGAERIGDGDLNYRFAKPGKDELSLVMQAFNSMTARLSEQRQRLDQRTMEFEALFEVGLSLISQQSLKTVLDTVAASVFKFIHDVQSVAIYTNENGGLKFYASLMADGSKDIQEGKTDLDQVVGQCAQSGEITRWIDQPEGETLEGAVRVVCIPLMIGNRVEGVLNVNFKRSSDVTDLELRPLILLGDQAAIALENARLHENEQREIRERKQIERSLIELNAELEQRVLVRTEELSNLNEELKHEIIERKAAIERVHASLKEKEVLLKEIHHRVKNNLQIVSSLLSLQASRLDEPEILNILRESQNRVRSMALLHEKLYQSDNLAQVDFGNYMKSLISYLLRAYRDNSGRVETHIEVDPVELDIDTAVPCGLILNELVSNALKHAFPDNRRGDLYVEFRAGDGDELTLRVADNGVGFPPDVDVFNKQTLGLQLVSTLVSQLDGHQEVNGKNGTEFSIRFRRSPVPVFDS